MIERSENLNLTKSQNRPGDPPKTFLAIFLCSLVTLMVNMQASMQVHWGTVSDHLQPNVHHVYVCVSLQVPPSWMSVFFSLSMQSRYTLGLVVQQSVVKSEARLHTHWRATLNTDVGGLVTSHISLRTYNTIWFWSFPFWSLVRIQPNEVSVQ